MTMRVIFDIDGTLADISHRLHLIQQEPKDWKAFGEASKDDAPIVPIVTMAIGMMTDDNFNVAFCTGRMEHHRAETLEWLTSQFGDEMIGRALYMRGRNDFRPDDVIKSEILDMLIEEGMAPDLVFEDRQRVVEMWRRRGIACCQVAPGNF